MPGYKKPMMGHKPKMSHGKKPMMYGKKPMMAKKGLAALAAKVPELTYTPKMMKVMGNKGAKNTPLNFKDLDVNNAKAMDYHKKTMMYGTKPNMYGNKPMDHKKGHSGTWTYTSSNGNTTEIRIGSKDDITLQNDTRAQVQRKKQLDKIKTS